MKAVLFMSLCFLPLDRVNLNRYEVMYSVSYGTDACMCCIRRAGGLIILDGSCFPGLLAHFTNQQR
jgi:hypothetical protein